MHLSLSNYYKENTWGGRSKGEVLDRDGKIHTSAKMNENYSVVVSNDTLHKKIISTMKTINSNIVNLLNNGMQHKK